MEKNNRKPQKPTKNQIIRKRKETIKHKKMLQELGLLPEPLPKRTFNKLKEGRPTKYRPQLCAKIIELMAEGKTRVSAITEMGITEPTFWSWTTEFISEKGEDSKTYKKLNTNFKPDFLKAVKIGEALNRMWWEEVGRLNIHNKDFNSTLYMMQMQNRHGWTRKLEGKVDVNEMHTTKEIKEIIFKFDKEEIRQYIGELAELGVIETPAKIN